MTAAEVREFVLWLQRATKPRPTPRKKTAATAGTINPITREQYPGDQYAVRTMRHSNAVIRSFYEFWIERGAGPLVNPVPQERRGGRRPGPAIRTEVRASATEVRWLGQTAGPFPTTSTEQRRISESAALFRSSGDQPRDQPRA